MRFFNQMMWLASVPAGLFAISGAVGLWGQFDTRATFDQIERNEARVARDLSDIYAHGLQTGQALRNIVLDPANPKAYDNLKDADAALASTVAALQQHAGTGDAKAAAQRVADLRTAHRAAQTRVLDLTKSDLPAATKLLVSDETPAWRTLRAEVMGQAKAARESAARAIADGQARSLQTIQASIALAGLACLAAGGFLWMERRQLRRILGGDPEDVGTAAQALAQGDLATPVGAQGGVLQALETMRRSLREIVQGVRVSSQTILDSASEIANGTNDLSHRTEQTAANLQQVASAMDHVSSSVSHTAETAQQASAMAEGNTAHADEGGRVMDEVVQVMSSIGSSSSRISDIIGTIDGIAFQTNILALNAAVEAARAGEAGRGFAVVAAEVRTLAQRSSQASREIKTLIQASVEQVESGTTVVTRAREAIDRVVSEAGHVRQLIGEIATGTREQADGVRQIGQNTLSLDQSTQGNAALVEQTAAACSSLRDQAQALNDRVAAFRT